MPGGIAPTGRTFTTTHRIVGKVAEIWSNYDMLGVLPQLGLVAPPGQSAR
jgi:hypothetical protein